MLNVRHRRDYHFFFCLCHPFSYDLSDGDMFYWIFRRYLLPWYTGMNKQLIRFLFHVTMIWVLSTRFQRKNHNIITLFILSSERNDILIPKKKKNYLCRLCVVWSSKLKCWVNWVKHSSSIQNISKIDRTMSWFY